MENDAPHTEGGQSGTVHSGGPDYIAIRNGAARAGDRDTAIAAHISATAYGQDEGSKGSK